MRARFYSPDLRRFINADLLHGDITNSLTLNRYAYCNGDPVNGIDPFGLSKERGNTFEYYERLSLIPPDTLQALKKALEEYRKLHPIVEEHINMEELRRLAGISVGDGTVIGPLLDNKCNIDPDKMTLNDYVSEELIPSPLDFKDALVTSKDAYKYFRGGLNFKRSGDYLIIYGNYNVRDYININSRNNRIALKNIGKYDGIANIYDSKTVFKNNMISGAVFSFAGWSIESYEESLQFNDKSDKACIYAYNAVSTVASVSASAGGAALGAKIGTLTCPGVGTVVGFVLGYLAGAAVDGIFDYVQDEYVNPSLMD